MASRRPRGRERRCRRRPAPRASPSSSSRASSPPLVSGAAIGFDGQISVYDTRQDDAPCYACLFPPEAAFEEVACATMGVFAPLVGIIGSMQAAEALKLLSGAGEPAVGRLLMLDGLTMEWNEIRIARDPNCPVCAQAAHAKT